MKAEKSARWGVAIILCAGACALVYGVWHRLKNPAGRNALCLVVYKARRELWVMNGERVVEAFRVALGANPMGSKEREGDGATPEGWYYVCVKNPRSQYHLSLGISYPGPADAKRGVRTGLISEAERAEILRATAARRMPPWKTALGGEIFIHGGGTQGDWTAGCVALEDRDMAELFQAVSVRTEIVIHP